MTERDWRRKLKQKDIRISELEEQLQQFGDAGDIKGLRNELAGAKMQIGRLKAKIERLEAKK